jgi:PTH1 family peptidyl-tRNA hydrolase
VPLAPEWLTAWGARNAAGPPALAAEPTTFMNLRAVGRGAARFFKIAPQEILVAHDEPDPSPPGEASSADRTRHNGLKGHPRAARQRRLLAARGIGIGHPGVKAEVIDYVPKKPSPAPRRDREGRAGAHRPDLVIDLANGARR